ncbi:MAG: BON domain-containing protein [Alphaproteobacteria bacterium]
MDKRIWRICAAAAMTVMVAGCASSSRTSETAGQYVDSTVITAKVKEAIFAEPALQGLQISVETYKDTVQLSGFVDNFQAKTRATQVAAAVPGVRSVENDLIVK